MRRDWVSILADASARGLTQKDLAKELGVSTAAVCRQGKKYAVALKDGRCNSGRRSPYACNASFVCPQEWGLTQQEAHLVALLVDADEAVAAHELGDKITGPESCPQIVDVVIYKARKKLARFGVNIHRYYGKGPFLDPVQRKRLRAGAVTLKPSERTP